MSCVRQVLQKKVSTRNENFNSLAVGTCTAGIE